MQAVFGAQYPSLHDKFYLLINNESMPVVGGIASRLLLFFLRRAVSGDARVVMRVA